MAKGKVKWYNDVKGFGFIIAETGEEVFVHRTSLDSPFSGLEDGEEVTFDLKQGNKGPVAHNVKLVKDV